MMFERFLLPLMACAIVAVPTFAAEVQHGNRAPAAVQATTQGGHDRTLAFDAKSAARTNGSVTQGRVVLAEYLDEM